MAARRCEENHPEAEYKAYPIPSGPDGKAGRRGTANDNGVILINKDMKNPEVFSHIKTIYLITMLIQKQAMNSKMASLKDMTGQ